MEKEPILNWISDEDLFLAIKHVFDKVYSDLSETSLHYLKRNKIDPWTMLFSMKANNISAHEWIENEVVRQSDKVLSQAVGEFHQIVLGSCEGWINLGVGDNSSLDLKKTDNAIFAEIKNKYNTMNGDSGTKKFEHMQNVISEHPDAVVYLVQIISKSKKDKS